MTEYKSNSHKVREEQKETQEKRVQKVVQGTVRTKKKSDARKLADVFISEDAANVKSYILMDVLVPSIKKAIKDIVTDGIDMVLYGGVDRGKRKSGDKISYRDYYRREEDRNSYEGSRARTRFDYDDIVFESRGEAEAVLEQMMDVIDTYGFVTVADLYDMADLDHPYTSTKYGWKRLGTAEPVRLRGGGYILKLPKATVI